MVLLEMEQESILVFVITEFEVLVLKQQGEEQIILQEVIVLQVEEIIAALVVQEITTREAGRVAIEVTIDLLLLREVVALRHLHQEAHLDLEPHLREVALQEVVVQEVGVAQEVAVAQDVIRR